MSRAMSFSPIFARTLTFSDFGSLPTLWRTTTTAPAAFAFPLTLTSTES